MKKVFGMSKDNPKEGIEGDIEEGMPLNGGQPSYAPQGQAPVPISSPHNSGPHAQPVMDPMMQQQLMQQQ